MKRYQGQEDCLVVNVYTRDLSPDFKKPVMVFIHGGYYFQGDGNLNFYGPHRLMNEDIVRIKNLNS